jgi:DNA-binding PadR family transcriptional regulator
MRVTQKLTTTSYAVLAQVAVRPWSAYELAQQRVRYFRYTWPAAESAIYREVKRLDAMGLIEGTKEYTGKRARTVYTIGDTGKEALREWLGTPVAPFSMEFEAILRVFVAPLGTKEELIGTLEQVLADARDMLGFASHVKQEFIDGINVTQDQAYIRAIAVDFFISHLNTVAAWAERTLKEVETWDDLKPTAEKNQRGLERIRQTPVAALGEPLTGIATPPQSQMRDSLTRS